MPDTVIAKPEAPNLKSKKLEPFASERQIAVKAFYDAKDKAEKAAVVEKYPVLKTIFSVGEYT